MAGTRQPEDEAHDVLAAEAFAMPAPDPELHHHGPVVLPDDPTGDPEPHDILAAEEFPMPAPRHAEPGGFTVSQASAPVAAGLAAAGGLLLLIKRLTRR